MPPPAVADALEHEARAGAEHVGHLVLEEQHAGGGAALVGQRQVDPGGLSGGDQLRGHRADQREPVAAAADDAGREQRQRDHQHADPGQRVLAEQRSRRPCAVTPAARKARPRTVRPAQCLLTHRVPIARSGPASGTGTDASDAVEDGGGGAAAHGGLDAGQQPVRQHRPGRAAHVVGQHVVAPADGRAPPWRRAPGAGWRAARRPRVSSPDGGSPWSARRRSAAPASET